MRAARTSLRITSAPCAAYSLRMSTISTAAIGRSKIRRGSSRRSYRPRSALQADLERRGRRSQQRDGAFEPGPHDGRIAAVVTRRLVLLVRPVVLFIDHDQPDVFKRREDGGSRADDNADLALPNAVPLIVPLAVRESAVLDGHPLPEPALNRPATTGVRPISGTSTRTRRPAAVTVRRQPQIDLRLAAASHAVQERRLELLALRPCGELDATRQPAPSSRLEHASVCRVRRDRIGRLVPVVPAERIALDDLPVRALIEPEPRERPHRVGADALAQEFLQASRCRTAAQQRVRAPRAVSAVWRMSWCPRPPPARAPRAARCENDVARPRARRRHGNRQRVPGTRRVVLVPTQSARSTTTRRQKRYGHRGRA